MLNQINQQINWQINRFNLTQILLATIVIVFVMQLIVPGIVSRFDFAPLVALSEPWRFISSMFLHGDITHLFYNAFAILMFGPLLASRVDNKNYLIIFLGAGICGSILYLLMTSTPFAPMCGSGPVFTLCPAIGASGGLYGILGALAILAPEVTIFLFAFVPLKIRYAAVLWFVMESFGTVNPGGGIANAGHLGGLIFGLVYAWWMKRNGEIYRPNEWTS